MKSEYRGKWKVVNTTKNKIEVNDLSYDDAVKEMAKLFNDSFNYDYNLGEYIEEFDVQPSRKRKY